MNASSSPLKIALLSSTKFGYECLKEAIVPFDNSKLVGILTTPNTIELGKKKTCMTISSHAEFNEFTPATGCEIVTINSKPSASDYIDILNRWQADIVLVLGWYYLIPNKVLTHPSLGTIGIHASMLPKYRGMAPVSWAIINGEKETGVSLFYLDDSVDCGDIIAQHPISIDDDDDCATLYKKVTSESINILSQYLPLLATGQAPRIKQTIGDSKIFPRRSPDDGQIDWRWTAERINNFIRAQTHPYPGAFTLIGNRKLFIWRGNAHQSTVSLGPPGTISNENENLLIQTGSGQIRLSRIQWQDEDETNGGEHSLENLRGVSVFRSDLIEEKR